MIGLQLEDPLALERHDQPQHPVGGRVVRAHVDREDLLLGLEPGLLLEVPMLDLGGVDQRRRRVLRLAGDPRSVMSASSRSSSSAITRTTSGSRSRCG